MIPNFSINLSKKIYSFYPKYETLYYPTRYAYSCVNSNQIDIYIDASNFIEGFLWPNVQFDDNMGLVAGLINLAIHYRKFYLSHFNTYSRIFIVYSDKSDSYNRDLMPGYDNSYIQLHNTTDNYKLDIIKSNLELVSEVCKYIKDIYFVSTTIEPAVKIRSLITQHSKNVPIAIYSKDAYMCQIPATVPSSIFFKIAKNSTVERVDVIANNNALCYYMNIHRKRVNNNLLANLHPFLFSTVLALTNCKERNILVFMHLNKAISTIIGGFARGLTNGYPDINKLFYQLNLENIINEQEFMNRFKALDIVSQQARYDLTPEAKSTDWMIDTINNEALKEINDKYLITTPLNINDL